MKPKDTRTEQQKQSMYKLVNELMVKYKLTLTNVYCHNSFTNAKACPSFKLGDFKAEYIKWANEPKTITCPHCGKNIQLE